MENIDEHIDHCEKQSEIISEQINKTMEEYDNLCIEYWKWIGAKEYLEELSKMKNYNKDDCPMDICNKKFNFKVCSYKKYLKNDNSIEEKNLLNN